LKSRSASPTEVALDIFRPIHALRTISTHRIIYPNSELSEAQKMNLHFLTSAVTIRSPQNPEHLIPPRQLEGSRCALRDESTETRKNLCCASRVSPKGRYRPLVCVDDVMNL
jgi:hypothetical protein